jgi:pimeloyl-ACP methyl ester carboxylesterase
MQTDSERHASRSTQWWWISFSAGLVLLLLAVWQLRSAGQDVEITTLPGSLPPITLMTPTGESSAPRPAVLVGHGFAGSAAVMRGFGLALAHAGYTTVLWDFSGHGANPQPLPIEGSGDELLRDAEMAWEQANATNLLEPGRAAILGHSMGSGVALDFGVRHPDTAATIAVSPVRRDVSEALPRNLLLMAGALEPRFAENAESLLDDAGGAGGDPNSGTGRKLAIIPGVEHISILFSPAAQQNAVRWLDGTFGAQAGAVPYTDRRIFWYLVGVAVMLLVSWSASPAVIELAGRDQTPLRADQSRPLSWRLGALLGGVVGASLLYWADSSVGLHLNDAFGMLIGGYLLLWLAAAGAIALLLQRLTPSILTRRQLVYGLVIFGVLWLGVGLPGQMVWLHWLLIPKRLLLWPLGTALLLPWFLAVGEASNRARGAARIGWWLAHSALLYGGLFLSLTLDPALAFLMLIMPLLTVLLGLHALAATPYRGIWAYALSGAMFLSWTILAVFPLV